MMTIFNLIVLTIIVVFSSSIEQPLFAMSLKEQLSRAPNMDGLITEIVICICLLPKHTLND